MGKSVAEIERRIHDKRGNVAAVARSFGLSRTQIYRRIQKSIKLQAALVESRETMLDNAETELYDRALDGGTPELLFFLKTQGKSRGYIERNELTGIDGDGLVIKVVYGNTDKSP